MGLAWALDPAVLGQVFAAILPVWLLGALTGYLVRYLGPGEWLPVRWRRTEPSTLTP